MPTQVELSELGVAVLLGLSHRTPRYPHVNSLRKPRLSSLHPIGPTDVLDRGEWAGLKEDTGQPFSGLDSQVSVT